MQFLKAVLMKCFEECGFKLNEEKTKIVYCKDSNRRGGSVHTSLALPSDLEVQETERRV